MSLKYEPSSELQVFVRSRRLADEIDLLSENEAPSLPRPCGSSSSLLLSSLELSDAKVYDP